MDQGSFIFNVVRVVWEDPTSNTAWTDIPDAVAWKPHKIVTCGMLIHDDVDYLVVALSYDESAGTIGDFLKIPTRCVDEFIILA